MRGRRRGAHRHDPGNHPDRWRAVHAAGVRGRDPGRAGAGQRDRGGRPCLRPGRGFRAVHPRFRFRVRQRDRFRSHGAGAGDATAGSDGPAAVIATADSQRRWRRIFLIVGGIVAAYALLAPLTSLDAAQAAGIPLLTDKFWFRIATYVVMFAVLATAWNIIGGITGYAAFGNVAFFGIGAYTTGMLIAKAKWPFLVALPLAPILAALFAALVGLPLLRLRGHYFAVASLGVGVAVGELVQNIDYNGQPVFGGASGLFLPIYAVGHRGLFFFYLMCGAAAIAIAVTWWVLRSRFGYGLIAIRENEDAAAVIGVNTTAYKVAAFALAAAPFAIHRCEHGGGAAARAAGSHQAVRRRRRGRRRDVPGGEGRDPRRHRSERRRQDDSPQLHQRRAPGRRRRHPLGGQVDRGPAAAPHRQARHRAHLPDRPAVRFHDGAGERRRRCAFRQLGGTARAQGGVRGRGPGPRARRVEGQGGPSGFGPDHPRPQATRGGPGGRDQAAAPAVG